LPSQRYRNSNNEFVEEQDNGGSSSKRPMLMLMAVLIVALLVIVGLIAVISVPSKGDDTSVLTTFSSGADNIILGGKGSLNTGYIKLPKNAQVKSASFNVTGMLPNELVRYDVGIQPISIVASDLDNDVDPDIVVLNNGNNEVTVLKNLGTYGYARSSYDTLPNSLQVITADLNDDHYLDLAVVSSNGNVSVFLTVTDKDGNWDFNYATRKDYPVGPFSFSLCALDYDKDSDLDMVVSCKNSDTLDLLKNDGSGKFTSDGSLPAEDKPGEVVSADFNKDGYPDIAVTNRGDRDYMLDGKNYTDTVSVYINKKGEFDTHIDYGVGENPSGIALSDLNNDGYTDILTSGVGFKLESVSILLNQGDGTFPEGNSHEIGAELYDTIDPNDIMCGDLNGDGFPDIATACRTTDSVAILLNDGQGRLGQYSQYYVGYSPKAMDLADFDGDGDLDITTANMRALNTTGRLSGSISIIKNHGYGVFSTDGEYDVGNCPRGISIADFDNDDDLDISTANYFGSTLSVLPNDGQGRFGERDNYLLGLEPYAVQAADFDGDGYQDVASADEARFVVIILFNDGSGHFKNDRPDYNIGGYPFSLHTGDYDEDGDQDVITANHGQSTLAILYNKGNGTFEDYHEIYLGPTRMPFEVAVVDVDNDGHDDLVTANLGTDNAYTNTISILFNEGNRNYSAPVDYTVGEGPTDIAVIDFDGDGDRDIATTNLADGTISVLTNDGNGDFTYKATIPIGRKPYFLEPIDLDFDGDMDLVATNSHSNSMSFLLNDGTAQFTNYYEKVTGSYPYQIGVEDLDKDGRDEIVVTNVNTASVSVISDYYYPSDISIDIDSGPDSEPIKISEGIMDSSLRTKDIASEIQSYLKNNQALADEEGNILVPLTVLKSEAGMVKLSQLLIEYDT